MLPSYTNRRNKIFYSDITEVIENKSAIEKTFSFNNDTDYSVAKPPFISNIPKTNTGELNSELLLEENLYKFENGSFKKLEILFMSIILIRLMF